MTETRLFKCKMEALPPAFSTCSSPVGAKDRKTRSVGLGQEIPLPRGSEGSSCLRPLFSAARREGWAPRGCLRPLADAGAPPLWSPLRSVHPCLRHREKRPFRMHVCPVKSRSTELRTLRGGSESPALGGRMVHSGQTLCSGVEESHRPPGPRRPGVSFMWPTGPHMGTRKREFQQGQVLSSPAQPSL